MCTDCGALFWAMKLKIEKGKREGLPSFFFSLREKRCQVFFK